MRAFKPKPVGTDPETPWRISWISADGQLQADLPLRIVATLDSFCNSPDPVESGLLLGYGQHDAATGKLTYTVVHAIALEFDAAGQLTAGALSRLTASCPSPDKKVTTAGLFVRLADGEPETLTRLLAGCAPLFPDRMIIIMVSPAGSASIYCWHTTQDKVTRFVPELALRAKAASEQQSSSGAQPLPEARDLQDIGAPDGSSGDTRVQYHGGASEVMVRVAVPQWFWVCPAVLAAVLLLGGTFWYIKSGRVIERADNSVPRGTSAAQQRLSLRVLRQGSDLLISWDHNLPGTLRAQHGILEITDQNQPNVIALSERDLNAGQVLYVPHSGNVEIQLTVVTPTDTLVETARVIQPQPELQKRVGLSRSTPVRALGTTPVTLTHRPDQNPFLKSNGPAALPSAASARDPFRATAGVPPTTADEFSASPPQVPRTAVPASQADSDILAAVTAPPAATASQTNNTAPVQKPASSASTSVSPATMSTQDVRNVRVRNIQPAIPIRQNTPILPSDARRMLRNDVVISVKVKINETGKVTSTDAGIQSGSSAYFGKLAEQTAKGWRFRPATIDGTPVPSESNVTFLFKR